MEKKVALVTGASSGIGRATALELMQRGITVYGTARDKEKLQSLEEKGLCPLSLDVTEDASRVSCVDEILIREGRIDILINNAGYGSYGAIEDVPLEEGRHQMEVNLFGLARMTQLVVPHMRKNHYGKIVNISSMAGKVWTPFGGWYHAAKFAVEGFSDCLRLETAPFGIDVIIIEPGGIKTDWGLIAANHLKEVSLQGAYAEPAHKVADDMDRFYKGERLSPPELVAATIGKAVSAKKPRTRYLIGYSAKASVLMKNLFGDRAFDKLISRFF